MSKTLIELKEKRARYEEWLEGQQDLLRRTREKFEAEVASTERVIADYREELADLDKAIAALLDPVPSPSPESSSQETVTEAADPFDPTDADFASLDDDDEEFSDDEDEEEQEEVAAIITAIPDGMTPWASGDCPVPANTLVEAVYADHQGNDNRFHLGDGPAGGMNWNGKMTNNEGNPQSPVIAYRVIEAPAETPPPVSELDSQVTPQDATEQSQENPAAQMFGKALAAESEAKEQRKYNPFAIFGAKVDA